MSSKPLFYLFFLCLFQNQLILNAWSGEDDRLPRAYADVNLRQRIATKRVENLIPAQRFNAKSWFLTSAKNHQDFMKNLISEAKEEIVICSPRINPKYFRKTFGGWIAKANKGVKFTIYTKDKGYVGLIGLMGENLDFKGHDLHFKTSNTCNAKFFIQDKKAIAIGSYNWLNTTKKSNMTVVNAGNGARRLIAKALMEVDAGLSAERDYSLQVAMTVKISELVEEGALKASKSQPDLGVDVKVLTARENMSD